MSNISQADIRRLDIGTLLLIRRILKEGSVTTAARHAGVSQPAASNALARCRRIFGDPLIVRGPAGMSLTMRGATLLDRLDTIAPQIDALTEQSDFVPTESDKMFTLAASDHASLLLLPRLTEHLRGQAPRARLAVSLVQSGGADIEAMERAGVDLRLGWLQALPQSWYVRKLFDDGISVICRADLPVTPDTVTADFVLAADHVALSTDRPYYQTLADQALARQSLQRKVGVWVTNFTAIPLIVAQSDMVAFFPTSLARMYQGFAAIKILPSPFAFGSYNLSMAWHPRIHEDRAYRWLRERIITVAGTLEGTS